VDFALFINGSFSIYGATSREITSESTRPSTFCSAVGAEFFLEHYFLPLSTYRLGVSGNNLHVGSDCCNDSTVRAYKTHRRMDSSTLFVMGEFRNPTQCVDLLFELVRGKPGV